MEYIILMDTGDMFQGSELSVMTTGEAMIPIFNALDYDLYLSNYWEVICSFTLLLRNPPLHSMR